MAGDSEWDVLQVRLTHLRQAVAAEIRAYPAPILACDAQYSHLLERRTALAAALASLGPPATVTPPQPSNFARKRRSWRRAEGRRGRDYWIGAKRVLGSRP